jgi:DNA-binding SARP family transcriptional activator/tetratricopeptide (TPR) repeat protein
MNKQSRQQHAPYPAMRVHTCGEFALERLIPARSVEQPPAYEPVPREAWSHRGPALTLLKVLLCAPGRRASKDVLIEALWPAEQREGINTEHALHAAVSVLRNILRLPNGESLLLHTQGGDGTGYRLAGQEQLWVDIDAFDDLVAQVSRAPHPEEALALWEAASPLTQGPFLPDDLYSDWSQVRRRTREGHRRLCIHRLADLSLSRNRREEAEVVLRTFWAENPTDEDALCRLMQLLAQQERTEEALLLYVQSKRAIQEEGRQPSLRTRDLAVHLRQARLAQGPALRLETHRAPPEHVVSQTVTQTASSELLREDAQADLSLSEQVEGTPFPGISQALFASTVLHPMLQAYEDVLVLAWEAFYTSSVQRAASTVEHWLLHLAQQIITVPGMSSQFAALRCRFLQLKSVIARDRTDFSSALATINEALTLAFHLQSAELVASSLYRRAKIRAAQQRYDLAVQDLEAVLPYAQRSRDPLRYYIAMFLAEAYSLVAPGDTHFTTKSLTLLDEVDRAVRTYGVLEGDGSFVKVDVAGLFMIRGDVLRRAGQLTEAAEALQVVRQSLPKEFIRWQGNLCLSEAHVALAGQDVEQSCQVTEEALAIFQATQSRSGLAKVQRLYASLRREQPSHRRVQDLGARLDGGQHERITQETDR